MVLVETVLLVEGQQAGKSCVDVVENYVFWNNTNSNTGDSKEVSSQFDFVYDLRDPAAEGSLATQMTSELVPPLLQSLWHGDGNFVRLLHSSPELQPVARHTPYTLRRHTYACSVPHLPKSAWSQNAFT